MRASQDTPIKRRLARLSLLLLAASVAACVRPESSRGPTTVVPVAIERPGLYPETIVFDATRAAFLVGSLRHGGVYQIDSSGQARAIVDDARLTSVLGIALDEARDRLWVTNSDIGSSTRPSASGPKKLAAVGVYELSSGKPLQYVELARLVDGPHLLNGIALDDAGDAYVTDSFSPAIYKVTQAGEASVFAQDPRFAGEGINLNGLVVHPDGYLLVIKKSDGALFKVPLDHPEQVSQLDLGNTLVGGDGLLLTNARQLMVIANKVAGADTNAAFTLGSEDGWRSATLVSQLALGDVYPTTAVRRGDRVYVLHSKLDVLMRAPPEEKASLAESAVIRDIGKVEALATSAAGSANQSMRRR